MTTSVAAEIVVYRARNLANGKHYIGVTKQGLARRERGHRTLARDGGGYRLHAALRKHGDAAFVFEEAARFEDLELAWVYEAELVDKERPAYNSVPGGVTWYGQLNAETREKLDNGTLYRRKRRPATPEELIRRREKRARYVPAMLGKHHSEETKAKLSAAKKGSPGFWTGKRRTDLMGKFGKPVVCLTTGVEYPNIARAEEALGLGKDRVGRVVRGEQQTTRGLRFRFKEV